MVYERRYVTMNKRQTKKFVKKKHHKKYSEPVFNDPNTIKMVLDELQSIVDGADSYDVTDEVVTLLTEVNAELNTVLRKPSVQKLLKT